MILAIGVAISSNIPIWMIALPSIPAMPLNMRTIQHRREYRLPVLLGNYQTEQDALKKPDRIKLKGFKEAFVATCQDGKRVE